MTPDTDASLQITEVRSLSRPRGFVTVRRADGRSLQLRRDVAHEHGIRLGEAADDASFAQAEGESQRRHAWQVATRFLVARARSRQEVETRLRRAGIDEPVIGAMIARLLELGYLDDAAFAAAWVEGRTGRRARGRTIIVHELRAKGIEDEIATDALDAGYGDELDVARPLAEKRARRLRGADYLTFRRRLGAYLTSRGFGYDASDALIRELWETHGGAAQEDAL